MKFLKYMILLFLLGGQARPQDDGYVISQRGIVTVLPVFQLWSIDGGMRFSEASAAVNLYTPLSRSASLSLRTSGGSLTGDVNSLSGLADGQVSVNYHLERANTILTLGLNLPSGKKKLTQEEFETSGLISNTLFRMQIPNFGTGFHANPGVIWAVPVSEDFVVGLGVSYQYQGKFQPLEEFGDYDPGDEILATGGCDVKMGAGTTVSLDVVFTMYGKDKLDGVEVFAAGNTLALNAQFRKQYVTDALWLLARYRSRGKAQMQLGNIFVTEDEKTEPDQIEISASYTMGINEGLMLSILAEGRFSQETPAEFSGVTLGGVGIGADWKISENISLPARFKFQAGKIKGGTTVTGIEAGIGMSFSF